MRKRKAAPHELRALGHYLGNGEDLSKGLDIGRRQRDH